MFQNDIWLGEIDQSLKISGCHQEEEYRLYLIPMLLFKGLFLLLLTFCRIEREISRLIISSQRRVILVSKNVI